MHKNLSKHCRTAVALALSFVLFAGVIPASPVQAAGTTNKTASEVVKDMTAGWNVGNTLDAQNGELNFPIQSMNETGWGNPAITKTLIESVGEAGFNTIRVPVSWGQYMDPQTGKIQDFALKRVKEVVDLCIDNDMYVILNTHHDIAEEYKKNAHYFPSAKSEEKSKKFFKNVWTQVGNTFKDYDYHLVFETMNEPRLVGHSQEWWFPRNNPSQDVLDAVKYINEYNQVALDAIRATGGNNATRVVTVPGYDASPDGCLIDQFQLPKDSATNRLCVTVHAYTPYYFALANDTYITEFDRSSKTDIDTMFRELNDKYMSKGIPVIVDEMGASNRSNTKERAKWADYYWNVSAKYPATACCIWDNGISDNNGNLSNGEVHGYFDRNSGRVLFPEIFDAIMKHVDGTPAKSAGGVVVPPTTEEETTEEASTENPSNPSATATLLNTYGASYGHFGTCINLSQLKDKNTLDIVKKHYNSVTLENEMKPDSILRNWSKTLISVEKAKSLGYYIPANYKESTVPELNFNTIDQVMKICCENNLGLRAHTLVWHSQTPDWFFRTDYSKEGNIVSASTMDARMEMYIKTVMNHVYSYEYGKCVYAWDVVNEYPHADNANWKAVYGSDRAFLKKAYEHAYSVLEKYNLAGKVSLVFNDYNTYMEVPTVLNIVKEINADKKICDAIGMQSHVGTWYPTVQGYTSAIKSFLNAGYEVQITELDVKSNNGDQEMAEYVYDLFKAVNQIKKDGGKITGITWWGLSDEVTWISGQKPLLFATPTKTKPAYDTFLKAYKEVLGDPKEIKDPEYPSIEQPTSEEPTSEEPTSEEPTSEEPTSEEPTSEESTSEEPTSEEPTSEAPATGEMPGSKVPTRDHDQIMVFFKNPNGQMIDEHRCALGAKVTPEEWLVSNIEHEYNGWGMPVVKRIVGWRSTLTGKTYSVDQLPRVTDPVSYYAVFEGTPVVEPSTEEPSTQEPSTQEPSTEEPVTGKTVVITNVAVEKTIDLASYDAAKIKKIVVKFKGNAKNYNGAVVLGQWAQQLSFNQDDCANYSVTMKVEKPQNTLVVHSWYADATLELDSIELVY